MRRPPSSPSPSPRSLTWQGQIACFSVLACGLWVIISQHSDGQRPLSIEPLLAGCMLTITPLCFLCNRPSMVQSIISGLCRVACARFNAKRPRTDP